MKDHHLRARLPANEYSAVKSAADQAGLTLSEHVRCVLSRDRQVLEQEQFLKKIDSKFAALSGTGAQTDRSLKLERLLIEVLLLTRELAADRNAQILARVSAKLNPQMEGNKS